MRKILAIARRELLASVKTRAFVLTIVLMPFLMGISLGLQSLFKSYEDAKEKRYAIIDRSPDEKVGKELQKIVGVMQTAQVKNAELRSVIGAKTTFDLIPPATGADAVAKQRYELSQKIDKGEYEALIEIGEHVPEMRLANFFADPAAIADDSAVRYQAKNPAAMQFRRVVELLLNQVVQMERYQEKGVPLTTILQVQQPLIVKTKALTRFDAKTGAYVDGADETQIINMILPAILMVLMFMIIMIGATPAMHGVVEEKSLRIAEVLLGSVTPFELMAGKLLGVLGVSLTMAAVYLGGGGFLATYFGFAEHLPLHLILWFVPMLVLALLIFGSLFIAVGAAASDIKDTQTLLMPIMMIACFPLFALSPIIQDPNGPVARACTFFPFATPMLLVARQSVPPGVPLWEKAVGVMLVLATTFVCVWAAGRIFRIGILSQGKTPRFIDLLKWAAKG